MSHGLKRWDRQQDRREEATKRQEEYSKRTPQEKLARLDHIFGVGVGAAKERARLNKLLGK